MDASARLNFEVPGDYAGPPPILIAASSGDARQRAKMAAEAAGYRTAAVAIEDAVDRLDIQAAASAIWVELDSDGGTALDRLLDRIDAESDRLPAVVSAPLAMIDPIAARLQGEGVHLLFDATEVDRIAALAVATGWARSRNEARAHDISKEPSSARLRQLSDEVSRIAATLARLSTGPGAGTGEKSEPPKGDAPQVSLEIVRQIIRARRLRARYFDEELFADPAWDMLLDLLQAEIAQRARILAVHRRGSAGDDRAPLDQDDDRCRPVQAPRRSARWPPRVHRAGAQGQPGDARLFRRGRQCRRRLICPCPPPGLVFDISDIRRTAA